MDSIRFVLIGQDKVSLSIIKNSLSVDGHTFIGYSSNHSAVLRLVRTLQPELVVIEPCSSFREVRQYLEVIDEELLSACIILLDQRKEDIIEFISMTRAVSYITKPVYDDVLLQIADNTLSNYRRIVDYESRLKKLNGAMETRKIVERAKWLLVDQDALSEADAYDAIRKMSRDKRITMKATAESIILTKGETKCIDG